MSKYIQWRLSTLHIVSDWVLVFLMQWVTFNCIDFANVEFHSSNPWLRNVYELTLSKRINAVQNNCLKNQNKSSCIHKYVPIHLCAWNKMMSLRNDNQYRPFLYNCGLILFSYYLFYVKWKNLLKEEMIKTIKPYNINQICSNILTDNIWFITLYQTTLCGTKACSKRCVFPSKSSVFPFYLM